MPEILSLRREGYPVSINSRMGHSCVVPRPEQQDTSSPSAPLILWRSTILSSMLEIFSSTWRLTSTLSESRAMRSESSSRISFSVNPRSCARLINRILPIYRCRSPRRRNQALLFIEANCLCVNTSYFCKLSSFHFHTVPLVIYEPR